METAIKDLCTTEEAAEILGYHPAHVRRILRQGVIKGHNFNGVWMIDRSEVERVKALQSPKGWLPARKKTHE